MKYKIIFSFLLIFTVLLTGCDNGEAAPASETLNILMDDVHYGIHPNNRDNPPLWQVTSGADVTVNLENRGSMPYNWVVVKPGEVVIPYDEARDADKLIVDSGIVESGETRTVAFTAPTEPGEYSVLSTLPNLYPQMQGRLVVVAP